MITIALTALSTLVAGLATICGWLVARNHTLNQLVHTQRQTIDTQARQLDKTEIIGELNKRILEALPEPRTGGKR